MMHRVDRRALCALFISILFWNESRAWSRPQSKPAVPRYVRRLHRTAEPPPALEARSDRGRRLIALALDALGGRNKIEALTQIRAGGLTRINLLEQSVRYEGPWLMNLVDFEEVCDFQKLEHSVKGRIRGDQFAEWTPLAFRTGFLNCIDRTGSPFGYTPQESAERLQYDPLRLMLLAGSTDKLRWTGRAMLNSTPHNVVQFDAEGVIVTLYLSVYSHLPTAVETVGPRQGFWSVWGDVTSRTEFSNWQLLPGGLRYPFSHTVRRDGLPQSFTTLTQATLISKPGDAPIPALLATNRIASTLKSAPTANPPIGPAEIAEGILQFSGGFNTQAVVLPEGIVVIDPVYGSIFNERLLSALSVRHPHRSVIGVIATDDAWPHSGGVRPYVARGIPVYSVGENRPYLEKLVGAVFRTRPDAQQRARRTLKFVAVSSSTPLGSGINRMQIYPVRGMESERCVVVYFPERRLLYASDLVLRDPEGVLYTPEATQELVDLVARERLKVDTIFAMHSGPIPWKTVLEGVDRARAPMPTVNR